uniref:Transcription factor asR3 n=2 Tax=Sarocladium TaxID=284134 RepID=ASR3_SARSH|nr:RecName: Full=Transcription factor asR3; AltName: Full=Xenovulene A biosynthesis cluster protein R3 [Sarocladium sp. 'schorii']AFD18258.1 R3 [Sarocladium strictum]AWM95792.1 transcription factor [Sarocladium sp. 'schorii']
MDKQQSPPPRRRRRPMLSCWECRRRKIKCDRNDPCAHCIRHETQCVFTAHTGTVATDSDVSRTRPGPKSASRPGVSIASGSNSAVATRPSSDAGRGGSAIPTAPPPRGPSSLPSIAGPNHPFNILNPSQDVSAPSTQVLQPSSRGPSLSTNTSPSASSAVIHTLLERIKTLEDSYSSLSSRHGDSIESRVSSIGEPRDLRPAWEDTVARHANAARRPAGLAGNWQDIVRRKSTKLGRSHRMGDAPDFAAIIECYSVMMGLTSKDDFSHIPEIKDLLAEGGGLLVESKQIAQRLKLGQPSKPPHTLSVVPPSPKLGQYLVRPTRERADVMAKLYFESFESAYRILHAPTFWANYEKYWQAPEAASNAVYLQILLVVAIGSSIYDHGDCNAVLDNIEMSRPCIFAAENWLADPFEKDRLEIAGLQVYCLCNMARQIYNVGGDLIWTSMGPLLYRALQVGLHREPGRLPGVSMFQAEIRRRLWATILDMVVQASLDALMPPMMSLDEFDVEPPANINDEEMDEDTTIIVPHPRTTFTSTSAQLALLETLPLRFGIVQYLFGMQSEQSYPSVLSLSSRLASALSMCNSLGNLGPQSQDQSHDNNMGTTNTTMAFRSITPFQRNLLDYLVRRFMTPLHMFFATQSHSNPVFHYSLTVSLDAALALVSPATPTTTTISTPAHNNEETNHFDRLLSTAGGLFREGFRTALTTISLALLVHAKTQQVSGTLHRAPQHRESLKAAVRDLVALAERRVRNGDTNIRAYMFLNMVLAQVEAMEAGARAGDGAFEMALVSGAVKSLRFCRDVIKTRAETRAPVDWEEMDFDADGMASFLPGDMDADAFGLDWDWESLLTTMDMAEG